MTRRVEPKVTAAARPASPTFIFHHVHNICVNLIRHLGRTFCPGNRSDRPPTLQERERTVPRNGSAGDFAQLGERVQEVAALRGRASVSRVEAAQTGAAEDGHETPHVPRADFSHRHHELRG